MALEVTGELVVSVVLFVFVIVAFIIFIYIFTKYNLVENGQNQPSNIDIVDREDMEYCSDGLDLMILRNLPVHVHKAVVNSKEFSHCSVCLTEVVDGEKIRLLPRCNHVFHMNCIDMWFRSHSTCPLCREIVGTVSENMLLSESRILPVNVLFWGRREHINNSDGRELEEITTGTSPSPYDTPSTSNRNETTREEVKSSMQSLPKRIVSFWCRENNVDVDINSEDLKYYDSCTF